MEKHLKERKILTREPKGNLGLHLSTIAMMMLAIKILTTRLYFEDGAHLYLAQFSMIAATQLATASVYTFTYL